MRRLEFLAGWLLGWRRGGQQALAFRALLLLNDLLDVGSTRYSGAAKILG